MRSREETVSGRVIEAVAGAETRDGPAFRVGIHQSTNGYRLDLLPEGNE